MEESFMMVPGAASAMRQGPGSQSLPNATPGYSIENIDDKFQQLARIFEIASGDTRVICCDARRDAIISSVSLLSLQSTPRA